MGLDKHQESLETKRKENAFFVDGDVAFAWTNTPIKQKIMRCAILGTTNPGLIIGFPYILSQFLQNIKGKSNN